MEQNNINRSVEEAKIKLNEMKEKAVAMFDEMQHNWDDLDDKIKNLVFVLVVIVLWELIKARTSWTSRTSSSCLLSCLAFLVESSLVRFSPKCC